MDTYSPIDVSDKKKLKEDLKYCSELWAAKVALALLKEREPVKPYLDYDGKDILRCSGCNFEIRHLEYTQADKDAEKYILFCKHCGRPIDWAKDTDEKGETNDDGTLLE